MSSKGDWFIKGRYTDQPHRLLQVYGNCKQGTGNMRNEERARALTGDTGHQVFDRLRRAKILKKMNSHDINSGLIMAFRKTLKESEITSN
jgi:hypothetical protein